MSVLLHMCDTFQKDVSEFNDNKHSCFHISLPLCDGLLILYVELTSGTTSRQDKEAARSFLAEAATQRTKTNSHTRVMLFLDLGENSRDEEVWV